MPLRSVLWAGPTLTLVSPERVVVAANGRARLRLRGSTWGFVRVGSQRRWVWGEFDETFVVRISAGGGPFDVVVLGVGGRIIRRVACAPVIEVQSPPLTTLMPTLHTTLRGTLPATRSLHCRRCFVPRVVRLTSASTAFQSFRTEVPS